MQQLAAPVTMAASQLTNKVVYLRCLLHTSTCTVVWQPDKHSSSLPQQAVCTSWPLFSKLVSLIWNSVVQSRTVMLLYCLSIDPLSLIETSLLNNCDSVVSDSRADYLWYLSVERETG